MVGKNILAVPALAAVAAALPNAAAPTATTTTFNPDPYCSMISSSAPYFPTQSASASSFCSSYFHISTRTTTTTTTRTTSVTATSSVAATTTVTPTTTVFTTTSTCYTSPGPRAAKRTAEPQPAGPTAAPTTSTTTYNPSASMSSAVSSACSCFGVTVSPTATATATAVSTTTVATVTTTTGTSTVTAPASTVNADATSTVPPSATYTARGGVRFLDWDGYDFYANDLASSYCGANGAFSLPDGSSVPCTDFNSCQDACVSYNAASGSVRCVAASYSNSNVFCYLKSAVADCMVEPNSNVDSGAITPSPNF